MFRYDRPQAGRYRQFWQFDVEAIGDPGPAIDAEIIELARALLSRRPASPTSEVRLNSIGDAACRPAYIEPLAATTATSRPSLPAARARAPGAQPAPPARLQGRRDGRRSSPGAPTITDHLCDACAAALRRASAPTSTRWASRHRSTPRAGPRPRLLHADHVRVLPAGREGQQDALGGGGRYDGLVELLGGKPTPGHRLRDRPRPGRAGARGPGLSRRARAPDRWWSWSAPTRPTR